MADAPIEFRSHLDREYVVPEDLAKDVPVYFANHVNMSVTSDGVGFVFCMKMDSLGSPESNVAVPKAICFVSIQQAMGIAQALGAAIPKLLEEIQRQDASQRQGESQAVAYGR